MSEYTVGGSGEAQEIVSSRKRKRMEVCSILRLKRLWNYAEKHIFDH